MSDPMWIDGVPYNGIDLRPNLAAHFWKGESRAFSARPGIIQNAATPVATISGMTVTVRDLNCVLSPDTGDPRNGSYLAAIPTTNLTVTIAHGSLPRVDILYAAIDDATSQAVVDIATGTAAASPSDPAVPSGALPLSRISVPAGSSSPTIAQIAQVTTGAGGILPVRDSTQYPTGNLQQGWYIDDSGTDQLLRYSGSTWQPVASVPAFNYSSALALTKDAEVTSAVSQTSAAVFQTRGGPFVTVNVPISKKVKVEWGARTLLADNASAAAMTQMQILMTGANTGTFGADRAECRNNGKTTGGSYSNTSTGTQMVYLSNTGNTTFEIQYYFSSGTNCTWDERWIIVTPQG